MQWAPLLPLLQGPRAGLGAGTWLCPSPNSPGLSSSPVPSPHQRMITPFLSSPSSRGLQTLHHHSYEAPASCGPGAQWEMGKQSIRVMCVHL